VSVPVPSTRPALKTAEPPEPGAIVPRAAGATLHATLAGDVLPYASLAAARSLRVPCATTLAWLGVTASATVGPATIVTTWVAAVTPAPDAVTVCRPASVSR
jgi:hypothetical protein